MSATARLARQTRFRTDSACLGTATQSPAPVTAEQGSLPIWISVTRKGGGIS